MCLSVPAEVISIDDNNAKVSVNGNMIECNIQMLTDVSIGDFVLVHAGFAIEKISEEEAKATLELFDEFEEFQKTLDD